MKKSQTRIRFAILAVCAAFISACVTDTDAPPPPPAPVQEPLTTIKPMEKLSPEQVAELANRAAAQSYLDELVALFNKGDYQGTIRHFDAGHETLKRYKEMELAGLKYSAFSYCLTKRKPACKAQFEKALKLEPSFNLDPGEKGHPLWGPVFNQAKKKLGS